MRYFLIFIAFLLTACTAVETASCPAPKPREPQCPFGQPVLQYDAIDVKTAPVIVQRAQYTLAYDPDKRVPVWVCETVADKELFGPAERKTSYPMDPLIARQYQSSSALYTNTGFDRGHLLPAADQLWNQAAMNTTFYMSNVAPMPPSFNRGVWGQFEAWIRNWVMDHGPVYVITGTLNTTPNEDRTVLNGEVEVPTHFYKIVVTKTGDKTIGFLFDVKSEYKKPYDWRLQVVAIDTIENMGDIDFMPLLTQKQEAYREKLVADFSEWQ